MTYEVDETAAAVVRLVYEKYLEGWGYAKIAKHLTASGIPTPRTAEKARKEADGTVTYIRAKNVWSIVSVQGILQNDFYTGVLRQRKYHRRGINGATFRRQRTSILCSRMLTRRSLIWKLCSGSKADGASYQESLPGNQSTITHIRLIFCGTAELPCSP